MGRYWMRTFPKKSKYEIREFLMMLSESFAFHPSSSLNFRPDDSVYGIYCAVYPGLRGMDCLELETLADFIERRYDVDFNEIWSTDLTLGDLFDHCVST